MDHDVLSESGKSSGSMHRGWRAKIMEWPFVYASITLYYRIISRLLKLRSINSLYKFFGKISILISMPHKDEG